MPVSLVAVLAALAGAAVLMWPAASPADGDDRAVAGTAHEKAGTRAATRAA